MSEVGCLEDGHFNNLHVEGVATFEQAVTETQVATVAAVFLTAAQSGHMVPVDMSVTDAAIVLPEAKVGLHYHIVLKNDAGALADNSFISAGPALVATQSFWGGITLHGAGVASTGGPQNVGFEVQTQKYLCFAANSTLTGGRGGDEVRIRCMAPPGGGGAEWYVQGVLTTTGTPNANPTPMFTAAEIVA